MISLVKYQALGNDYLVIAPADLPGFYPPQSGKVDRPPDLDGYSIDSRLVRFICDRHFGLGSDGLLVGPLPVDDADFGLLIYNPDGSMAEKSGNGLRIFVRFLLDLELVAGVPFTIRVIGGKVRCQALPDGMIQVEMGQAAFALQTASAIRVLQTQYPEMLQVEDHTFAIFPVDLGNPHCVVFAEPVSVEFARHWGPLIENHPRFPKRTNVQFVQALDRSNLRIEIWERGAGYTLASGSSSCAAAFVACSLGLCGRNISVHMPGGCLQVEIDSDNRVKLTGPAMRVYDANLSLAAYDEFLVSLAA
jgi:diaminopimelate epimerase